MPVFLTSFKKKIQRFFSSPISAFTSDVWDFSPGLLAIQECPPARLPRMMLYVVAFLVLILLLWAIFGRLDIIATAEGRLVPQSYVKIVQPAENGIVSEILVQEGSVVKAGEVLMRMDPVITQTDMQTFKNDLALKSLALRRIQAELHGSSFMAESNDPSALYLQVYAQYKAHRQAYLDSLAQENEVLNKSKNELVAAREQYEKLSRTLPIYQQTADSYNKLVKEGFVSVLMSQDKQRERIEKEQDLKMQQATVASLERLVAQSEKKLQQIKSSYESQLLNEQVETESQVAKLQGELTKQAHKVELLELKAPQAGIIKDLATHTIGTVVSPGTIMMNLVPQGEVLQAEVAIKNEDVGFLQPHHPVKLKLTAYPFQKYGLLEGIVDHISADSNFTADSGATQKNNAASANNLSYKAIIKLNQQFLHSPNSGNFSLTPGMQVIAEINQGKRSVLEYLLSPVQKVVQEAARER